MSTLRVNTLQDATGSNQPAMVGAAKAWVNFNGTGTVAIREQFNVSSITDNGTGSYTLNFTTAMTDANYSFVGSTAWASGQPSALVGSSTSSTQISAGSLEFYTLGNGSDAPVDVTVATIAIFR